MIVRFYLPDLDLLVAASPLDTLTAVLTAVSWPCVAVFTSSSISKVVAIVYSSIPSTSLPETGTSIDNTSLIAAIAITGSLPPLASVFNVIVRAAF